MAGKRRYSLNKNSTKRCSQCGEYKNVAEFGWANKKEGWKQAQCRDCQKNKTYAFYLKRITPIRDYLKKHSCVDCGNSDYRVLEFDHVRGEKLAPVSEMWSKPWDIIQAEIDKCEVRCRNCHAIRHWEDGWNTGPKINDSSFIEYIEEKNNDPNKRPRQGRLF